MNKPYTSDELLNYVCSKVDCFPSIVNGIFELKKIYEDQYESDVSWVLNGIISSRNYRLSCLDDSIKHFIQLSVDTVEMQASLSDSGKFSSHPVKDQFIEVYSNESLMKGPYLTGLLLAQLFWPNFYHMNNFFYKEFIPTIRSDSVIIDVGAGHGFHTVACLKSNNQFNMVANDISPFSKEFIEHIGPHLYSRSLENIEYSMANFEHLSKEYSSHFNGAIFSEVLEHLDNPKQGLETLYHILKPGAPVFFSTATNAAFYDHTVIFENVSEIEELLNSKKFHVLRKAEFPIMELDSGRYMTAYCAIITKIS